MPCILCHHIVLRLVRRQTLPTRTMYMYVYYTSTLGTQNSFFQNFELWKRNFLKKIDCYHREIQMKMIGPHIADIDECTLGHHDCANWPNGENRQCLNQDGSFFCECRQGQYDYNCKSKLKIE